MTIDSIRGDANNRIIHQTRDKLNGLRPIDYLAATRPVVIMDEPQNMESELSAVRHWRARIRSHAPLLGHAPQDSATSSTDSTGRRPRPGLVKQIVVAEVAQRGRTPRPTSSSLRSGVTREAKLELVVVPQDGRLADAA